MKQFEKKEENICKSVTTALELIIAYFGITFNEMTICIINISLIFVSI